MDHEQATKYGTIGATSFSLGINWFYHCITHWRLPCCCINFNGATWSNMSTTKFAARVPDNCSHDLLCHHPLFQQFSIANCQKAAECHIRTRTISWSGSTKSVCCLHKLRLQKRNVRQHPLAHSNRICGFFTDPRAVRMFATQRHLNAPTM